MGAIRAKLLSIGYQVVTVPEVATPIFENSGGYDPRWAGRDAHVQLQTILMKMQTHQEDAFTAIASLRPAPAVMLCDRGALDGFTFCSQSEWQQVLDGVGTTERKLLDRYDVIIHLASTALDAEYERFYEWGEGSNNPSRFHNPAQAKRADQKTRQIYERHRNYHMIKNQETFRGKINNLLKVLSKELGMKSQGAVAKHTIMRSARARSASEQDNRTGSASAQSASTRSSAIADQHSSIKPTPKPTIPMPPRPPSSP